jgi:hypothetical protein
MDRYLKYLFAVGCILGFVITGYFASWDFMEISVFDKLFTTIQFPWRLFGIASILFIFAGCIWLSKSKILGRYTNVLIVSLVLISILSGLNVPYNDNNFAYYDYNDTETSGHANKVTGILKSDSTIIEPYEWRIDYLDDEDVSTEPSSSNDEQVEIISFEKSGTKANLVYAAEGEGQYIEFPIMNYIGYAASDENGEKLEIETGSNSRLRVWINGDNNVHTINVRYQMPIIFTLATVVSIITYVAVLVIYLMRKYYFHK